MKKIRDQKRIVLLTNNQKPIHLFKHLFVLLLVVWFLMMGAVGCSTKVIRIEPYSNILESSYAAADMLDKALRQQEFNMGAPMLAASFVNIDNLNESCTLGRIITEQISSRLAQHGYKILEMKLRQESVFIKEGEGEFLLSRELKNISSEHKGYEVLVGSYAVAEDFIFISARIVRTKDNVVLAGHDYRLIRHYVTESLLR
jgi:TolB-like protein